MFLVYTIECPLVSLSLRASEKGTDLEEMARGGVAGGVGGVGVVPPGRSERPPSRCCSLCSAAHPRPLPLTNLGACSLSLSLCLFFFRISRFLHILVFSSDELVLKFSQQNSEACQSQAPSWVTETLGSRLAEEWEGGELPCLIKSDLRMNFAAPPPPVLPPSPPSPLLHSCSLRVIVFLLRGPNAHLLLKTHNLYNPESHLYE